MWLKQFFTSLNNYICTCVCVYLWMYAGLICLSLIFGDDYSSNKKQNQKKKYQ